MSSWDGIETKTTETYVDRRDPAQKYRDEIDPHIESLAYELFGFTGGPGPLLDWQIVEIATKKISTLKKILVATGFSPKVLKAIMDE